MSEEVTLDEFVEGEKENTNQQNNEQHLPEIDEIPSDWRLVVVEDITEDLIGGGTPSKSNEKYWGGEIPWASVKDLNGIELSETEDYITEAGIENSATNLIPQDSIVVSTRMTVGEPFLNKTEMAINQDMKAVIPDADQVNSLFLVYSLWDKDPYLKSLGRGTTVDGITTNDLALTHLGLPSLPEQRRIATVLYTVDRAIEKTNELIDQYQRVKQGTRQDLLTSGVTEEGTLRLSPESVPEKYRDERQWTVPESWELKELSEVCSIQVGYGFKSDWYLDEGSVRVLRGANVGYGEPDWSETKYLESDRVSEYEEYQLEGGDLIIGMDRPYTSSGFKISRLSEADVPSLLVQRVGRFVPEACDPDYLHVVLSDWQYQKQVLRRAQGMDIPHISQTDILSPKIPLPPLDEQKRIADRYSTILERIDCEENLLREYKTLKQGLMQDLLSGTVRTTDTNIEVPDEIAQYG